MAVQRNIAKTRKFISKRQPLSEAWLAWCGNTIGAMDYDVTLHLPTHLAHHQNGDIMSQYLTRLFNRLDRHLFDELDTACTLRLPRFVTLERTDGVGWHAHVSLKIWRDAQGYVIDPYYVGETLANYWHDLIKQPKEGKFSGFFVEFKKTHDEFLSYSLKHIDRRHEHSGKVDILNCAADVLLPT